MGMTAGVTAEKVEFLSSVTAYPHKPREVSVVETHMAYVFLAGPFAFKMKKPVRYEFLDFTALESREFTCREELRLNRRLAPAVYLDVIPLTRDAAGQFHLQGAGTTVDWLVKMKRLPADRMLDAAIAGKTVSDDDIAGVARILLDFYRAATPVEISSETIWSRFAAEHRRNTEILSSRQFDIDHSLTDSVQQRMSKALEMARPLLAVRVAAGAIVEGHGDLRPEHICLVRPPVIIDCLEFNRELRIIDPFDELAYLDLECRRLRGSMDRREVDGYSVARTDVSALTRSCRLLWCQPRFAPRQTFARPSDRTRSTHTREVGTTGP